MPIGKLKNQLYGLAMPLLGKRCQWRSISATEETDAGAEAASVQAILKKYHAVGAAVQRIHKGQLTTLYTAGNARLSPKIAVDEQTVFRTASIAKTVTALLVFRLQTLGKLDVREDISAFLGYPVSNPHCHGVPITLAMLLSHTSSIIDSPTYFASFSSPAVLRELLSDPSSYAPTIPGVHFKYSNFAAGIIGCMLEKRFSMSLEALFQQAFAGLDIQATYDITTLQPQHLADSWRILPKQKCFDALRRYQSSSPLSQPDPESHYLLASGNVYLTAKALAQLTLLCANGGKGFLSPESLTMMQTPISRWPEPEVNMGHGMGLFCLDDDSICSRPLWGHQGFAYGAVNGLFFDADGNGFVSLVSGISEQRLGHLALVHKDLIELFWKGGKA